MIILTHFIAFFVGAVCATFALTCCISGARADKQKEEAETRKVKQAYDKFAKKTPHGEETDY